MSENKYIDYIDKNGFSIDFKTFPQVKDQMIEFMYDTKCPLQIKIFIGKWFFEKIYSIYKLSDDIKIKLTSFLINAISKETDFTAKGSYLKYKDVKTLTNLCHHFFQNRFDHQDKFFVIQLLNDATLLSTMVQTDMSDEELRDHFLDWIDECTIFEQKSNLLDVLLRYYKNDSDVLQTYEELKWGKHKKGSIYSNEQNAHDDTLLNHVMNAAGKLVDRYRKNNPALFEDSVYGQVQDPKDEAIEYLYGIFKKQSDRDAITTVFNRMSVDNTGFNNSDDCCSISFHIRDVMFALLDYIKNSKSKKQLLQILMDEMIQMKDLCSSGYIARLINVLQGFDDDYRILIDFDKQLYAIISFKMGALLDKADDRVQLGSFDPQYFEYYVNFVVHNINDFLPSIINDYGKLDVEKNILSVVMQFLGNASVKLQYIDGCISIKSNELDL